MKKNTIILVSIIAIIAIAILSLRFLGGNEDAWICQNGEWVKHGNPNTPMPSELCEGGEKKPEEPEKPEEKEPNIVGISPKSGDSVSFPFKVMGSARVFENTVRIELKDKDGKILFDSFTNANSPDIGQFGPFEKEIDCLRAAPASEDVVLTVFWDSPKDGSRLDEKNIPLKISMGYVSEVKVYFGHSDDSEYECQNVLAVERIIPKTKSLAKDTLETLLNGLFAVEYENGLVNSINPGVKIQKLNIKDKIAYVDFDETLQLNVGGSCRVSAIRAQITETLKQFESIDKVVISINGRTEDILQP